MALSLPPTILPHSLSRRGFLKASLYGGAGLALYSAEVGRHWVDVTRHEIPLRGLPPAFDGMRIAHISDIHMDDFTEPFFLRHVVDRINALQPDAVCITGDFVTALDRPKRLNKKFATGAAWQCANILTGLHTKAIYAVLGNHDAGIDSDAITTALTSNGITVLRNTYRPIERDGARFWIAGIDDAINGHPRPELAIPPSIRNLPHEPVLLLCHTPDYADRLFPHPEGRAIGLMLSGHTHGGQIRLPFLGAVVLPPMGRKYVEGLFRMGNMQLYVNRGIGAIGLPFRLNCPPEITLLTLRATA